jgi:hypothetical protein
LGLRAGARAEELFDSRGKSQRTFRFTPRATPKVQELCWKQLKDFIRKC